MHRGGFPWKTAFWMLLFFAAGLFGSYLVFGEISPRQDGSSVVAGRIDTVYTAVSATSLADSGENAIVRAAELAGPAVVSIIVYPPSAITPRPANDRSKWFRWYAPGQRRASTIGSGFIVDPSGIVLTNEHVVRDGARIEVVLSDGRTFEAKRAGDDIGYDLAVLKIEPVVDDEALPSVPLGRSAELRVGEWAIAIGNPFGAYLNDNQLTVTVGVISALHRDVKPDGDTKAIYKDMIQTDAAINPGNSGGPLLNAQGEVIGINTFIFSQGGGSIGIGFAIPIDAAVQAARDIIQFGRVRHGDLGIMVLPIDNTIAATYGIRDREGLIISRLEDGSPAKEAGLETADIIRAIDGVPESSPIQAARRIFGLQPGEVVEFTIERDGRVFVVPVRAKSRDEEEGTN